MCATIIYAASLSIFDARLFLDSQQRAVIAILTRLTENRNWKQQVCSIDLLGKQVATILYSGML